MISRLSFSCCLGRGAGLLVGVWRFGFWMGRTLPTAWRKSSDAELGASGLSAIAVAYQTLSMRSFRGCAMAGVALFGAWRWGRAAVYHTGP